MYIITTEGVVDLHYCKCPQCGGDLSTAFVSLQVQLGRFYRDLLGGNYDVSCDHCGWTQKAHEYKEVCND